MADHLGFLISFLLVGIVMSAQAQPSIKPQAEDSPRTAIEGYFSAHALGRSDFITQTFTPDAKIQFIENGQLKQWTRDEFAKRFQQPAADEYRRVRRIVKLDVSGPAASAVLTLDYPQVLFDRPYVAVEDWWRVEDCEQGLFRRQKKCRSGSKKADPK